MLPSCARSCLLLVACASGADQHLAARESARAKEPDTSGDTAGAARHGLARLVDGRVAHPPSGKHPEGPRGHPRG